jgi:CHASE2 domain-containing sensor protein
VLQNIFAQQPSGVGYDVYLDLPPGRAPQGRDDPYYVGTFHFFDTSPDHRREYRLNITDRLRGLAHENRLSAAPSITVVPGTPAQAEAQIGAVTVEVE